jgi:hypothetical protein
MLRGVELNTGEAANWLQEGTVDNNKYVYQIL